MSCDIGEVTESLENELYYDYKYELCSFSKLSITSPTSAHSDSPNFLSLHLCHSSFSNPSLALPTSQLILQPFCCFTHGTAHSPTLLSPLLRRRIFTYFTWRAAHAAILCVLLLMKGTVCLKGPYLFPFMYI